LSMIEGKHISFSYPEKDVLKDVSFQVEKGTFYAILGPNGSGKTTLIRCISAYLTPDHGEIRIDGKPLIQYSPKDIACMMALVPQHSYLEYDFTVGDIVMMGRNPHLRRGERESGLDYDIANTAMEQAGVLHLKRRSARNLSGGEWQRIIIARALAQQSPIMLMDEPVSSLDIGHQIEILRMAKELTKRGKSIVCVLHDLSLAMHYADCVLVMRDGEVYAQGKTMDVLNSGTIRDVYHVQADIMQHKGGHIIAPIY
jgi:iron complex transport system ATP-binding protein